MSIELKFNEQGLIPAVLQNKATKEVLMVAYMNREAFDKTIETGKATFYSRSRQQLWVKGETSGNFMYVDEIKLDCDNDTLLLMVNPMGPACHTGKNTCFYRAIENGEAVDCEENEDLSDVMAVDEAVIIDRKKNPEDGSYTNYLFDKGEDKILKKVGEEAAEVVIAGKNRDKSEISYEVADLIYHLTVMLVDNDMTWDDIYREMKNRR